jgi:hypothetical protein
MSHHSFGGSWEAFNAEVREKVIGGLRAVYRELARITEYDASEKRMRGRFAQGLSPAGTLGPIAALARNIESCLPCEPSSEHPGYLTAARVAVREAHEKSRRKSA